MRPRLRRVGQIDPVDVVDAALANIGEAGAGITRYAFVDDDLPLVRPRDTEVHAIRNQAIIGWVAGGNAVVDGAAGAIDVARYHIASHVAGYVDRVVAQPANHSHRHAG